MDSDRQPAGARDIPARATRLGAVLALDLVVTVDAGVADLAGALGRPVWVLLPFFADPRRLLDRDDSPWYPTARLYRQARPGDWGPVVERVAAELEALAGRRDGPARS